MIWFNRRLKKTGTDDAIVNNNAMTEDINNTMDDDNDYHTMDEKSYAAWKRGFKFSCVFFLSALLFLVPVFIFTIIIFIKAE